MSHTDSRDEELAWALVFISQQLSHLARQNTRIMSTISDFVAKQQAFNDQQSTAIDDISTELKTLNDTVTALQNSAGQITPEDQALLDQIQASSQAVTTKLQALDTLTPPAVPAPTTPASS